MWEPQIEVGQIRLDPESAVRCIVDATHAKVFEIDCQSKYFSAYQTMVWDDKPQVIEVVLKADESTLRWDTTKIAATRVRWTAKPGEQWSTMIDDRARYSIRVVMYRSSYDEEED